MKREIKFRAWDKNKKVFIPTDLWAIVSTDFNASGIMLKDWENYKEGEYFYENSQELSQFTGLTDKNRKEIYEGDIICNDKYRTWEWRGVVKFSHGVFGAEWFSNIKSQSMVGSFGQKHNLRTLDDDILESQVIIGNIYENPELL